MRRYRKMAESIKTVLKNEFSSGLRESAGRMGFQSKGVIHADSE
jgi:hypothetical protein